MNNITDKEQIEQIKTWWNAQGKQIAILVLGVVVIAIGWRYWQARQVREADVASDLYQIMLMQQNAHQEQVVLQYSLQLQRQYTRTPYAALSALLMAKNLAEDEKPKAALAQLQWVIDHSHVPAFLQIARIRAARLQIALGDCKAASALLQTVSDKSFAPLTLQVMGEIYQAEGNTPKALQYWQQAQASYKTLGAENPLLSMVLAN